MKFISLYLFFFTMAFDFKKAAFAAKKATGKYNPSENNNEEGGAPAFEGRSDFKKPMDRPAFKPEAKEDEEMEDKEDEGEEISKGEE